MSALEQGRGSYILAAPMARAALALGLEAWQRCMIPPTLDIYTAHWFW
jgi:hypothetical protein